MARYVFRNFYSYIFFVISIPTYFSQFLFVHIFFALFMQIELMNYAEVEIGSQITLLDRGLRLPDAQQKETYRQIQSSLQRALRALTCCTRDDVTASSS